MRTQPLHRGGHLTALGFGGAQLGNLYTPMDDDQARAAVDAAWDGGVRYYDTAPHYGLGLSERRLGAALRDRPRNEYVLSTKVGRLLVPSPETTHLQDDDGFVVPAATRRVFDFSRDGILRSVEASLGRLGVDRLDIAYLHDPDEHWASASTTGVDTLVELRDQGVVGAIGAGMNQVAMLTEFVTRCDVDVVMVAGRYTVLDQSAADTLLPAAAEHGVDVVAAGVYNSGITSTDAVPGAAHYDYREAPTEVLDRARAIAEVCRAHGVELPVAAVQFPFRSAEVRAVVLGMGSVAHVESGLHRVAADVPDALWDDLREARLVPDGR